MSDVMGVNDTWRAFCVGSMFEHHVPQMENILQEQFGGNTDIFQHQFLQPIFGLLADLKSSAQEYFCANGGCEEDWNPSFEKFVTSVVHIAPLETKLHKGEFYIHISRTSPGQLVVKYADSGQIHSVQLHNEELVRLWSPDWADLMRKERETRFLFLHCIVRTEKGLEKRQWKYLLREGVEEYKNIIKDIQLNSPESPGYKLQLSPSLMVEKPLHSLDLVFDVLQSKVAYLPGTRDVRGGPVIIVNASSKQIWETPDLTSTELARIFMYYWTIPRKEARDLGCSVVIDWRQSDLGIHILQLIGEAMLYFQENCPGGIHMSYILSTTDSPLLMFSASKVKEQLNFQFKLISSVDELKQYIENSQLTPEFGGTFHYDHDEWIRFRIKLEPFMTGCRSAAKLAMNVIEDLKSTQVGETVEECKRLVEQHEQKVKEVFDDSRLSALIMEGQEIILRLQDDYPLVEKTEDYNDSVECVTKLYNQMTEVFSKLDSLSDKRTKQLQECLQLRIFQEDAHQVLQWINDEGLPYIEKHQEIGDSLSHVHNLEQEFGEFEEKVKQNGVKVENVLEEGRSLSEVGHLAEGYGIKETSNTLKRNFDELKEKMVERKCQLMQSAELHSRITELSEWSLNSLKHMAWMNMEEITTSEGVEKLKESLDSFLASSSALWSQQKLDHLSELAEILRSNSLQTQAEQAIVHYKEVQDMLEKRKLTLQKAEERFLKASLASECASVSTATSDDSNSTSTSSAPGDESDDEDEELDKTLDEAPRRKFSTSTPEAPVLPDILFTWKEIEEEYVEEEEYINLPPKVKEKLGYIVSEMVETEKDYVKALEYIMENYLQEMEKPSLLPSLRGKKNILFGNIERLNDFHKRHFLQDLAKCMERPLHVGNCFIRWERQFFLYALYNKNKPKSDQLLQDHGNVYFRARQKELGDKLDLASYLIKPVQRMGKYGLLLRDMIKACNVEGIQGRRINELKAAEEMVKFQLRHGNDLLAMDSIRDCDVNVKEQGRLLQQNDFTVWHGKKKHERRVFLFEDLVLFSKTKKQPGGADVFVYKNSLKTADIGLTETVGDSGLKFELWFRRRKKSSETFVLQARSVEIKNGWVNAVTRILWKQAARSREYGLTEASTGISVGSQPAVHLGSTRTQGTGGCEDATPLNPTISFIKASPLNNESPGQKRKRLSLISSETSSSMESSSSSGVYDMYLTHSEEESNLARVRPGTMPAGKPDDKRQGMLKRSSSLEALCGTLHRGFAVDVNVNENGGASNGSEREHEEEKRTISIFQRRSSLRERRTKSIDDTKEDKSNNMSRKKSVPSLRSTSETSIQDNSKSKSHKRRSFIERLFSHEDSKDKELVGKLEKSQSFTEASLLDDPRLADLLTPAQGATETSGLEEVTEDAGSTTERKANPQDGKGKFDTAV